MVQHSRLLAVNGVWLVEGGGVTHDAVRRLLNEEALPAHMVFEAPPSCALPTSDEMTIDSGLVVVNSDGARTAACRHDGSDERLIEWWIDDGGWYLLGIVSRHCEFV